MKVENIEINGINYQVFLQKKNVKNINYSFKNGAFYVSYPVFTTKNYVLNNLEIIGPKLLKRSSNREDKKVKLVTKDFYYLYGEKYLGNVVKKGNLEVHYHNTKEFYNLIKEDYLNYLNERVEFYKNEMNLKYKFNVSVRFMKTRYGSNTISTHNLHFNYILVHFRKEIIDSVVVHELAHSLEANHGKRFYDIVYKYCPNYDELTKELKGVVYCEEDY